MFEKTKINEKEAGVGPFYKVLLTLMTKMTSDVVCCSPFGGLVSLDVPDA